MAERFPFDKSSKWLIQRHGNAILHLGGLIGPFAWRALQAEVVQPRRLPDGLIEVRFPDRTEPEYFVLELATYPEERIRDQCLADQALVWLDRGKLPELLVLVLHPKGNVQADAGISLASERGWSEWQARWRVVELWRVAAADLLAVDDVGLIPWVPLTAFDGPPEPLFQQCRDRIDRQAPADERANLLAVTQVLAGLRYNDPQLFNILGGNQAMIESPVLTRLLQENSDAVRQQTILDFLTDRFGDVPEDLAAAIRTIRGEGQLRGLVQFSAHCSDLEAFRVRLAAGTSSQ